MTEIPVQDILLQIFDVEHGACALLTCNTGFGYKRLMIDCGHNATSGFTPGRHLAHLNATQLEQLVVTNYDEDHVSGFRSFEQHGIHVQWTMCNPSVTPNTIRHLKTEDGMGAGIDALAKWLDTSTKANITSQPPTFPNVRHECFYNHYPTFDDENNLSLVLLLDVHGYKFLFPGDMERQGFQKLLATNLRFRQIVGDVHVLIAAHHGRDNGICEAMFDTYGCRPEIVVISDDYKQYDTQNTTNWYASRCIGIDGFRNRPQRRYVLSTRKDGEIRFAISPGRCHVS